MTPEELARELFQDVLNCWVEQTPDGEELVVARGIIVRVPLDKNHRPVKVRPNKGMKGRDFYVQENRRSHS